MDLCRAQLLVAGKWVLAGSKVQVWLDPTRTLTSHCELSEAPLSRVWQGGGSTCPWEPPRGWKEPMGAGRPAQRWRMVGALCQDGELRCHQPRPLLGPCPRQYLRGHRQTPSHCIQKRHLPLGAGWWHDTRLPMDGRKDRQWDAWPSLSRALTVGEDTRVMSARGQGPSGGGQSRHGVGSAPCPATVPPWGVRRSRAPRAAARRKTQEHVRQLPPRGLTCVWCWMQTGPLQGLLRAERGQTQCLGLEGSKGLASLGRALGLLLMGQNQDQGPSISGQQNPM